MKSNSCGIGERDTVYDVLTSLEVGVSQLVWCPVRSFVTKPKRQQQHENKSASYWLINLLQG